MPHGRIALCTRVDAMSEKNGALGGREDDVKNGKSLNRVEIEFACNCSRISEHPLFTF